MLSQKLYNFLLNANYSFVDTMDDYNNSMISDRKDLQIRSKTMNRREPALSHNVTLLIECGMVIIVMTIVGLVFYFSQRNFKKRSTVHRRRWLESDANIENYSDGQIYDTNAGFEEYQSQPTDLDQDDCPPPYHSVVQEPRILLKKNSQKSVNHYQNNLDDLNKHLPKLQSNYHDESQNNVSDDKSTSEPLMPSREPLNNALRKNEISSLIENGHFASSSSPNNRCYRDEECTISGKCFNDELKVEVHLSQTSKLLRTEDCTETDEKLNIDQTKKVDRKNDFVLLDASGLPSYDTALKIQECDSMLNCV